MATQGIKLIERLNNTHSDKAALNHKMMAVGSGISEGISFDKILRLGQPSLMFTLAPDSTIIIHSRHTEFFITVRVMVEELPVVVTQYL